MRFRVQACFATAADKLDLSEEGSENAGLLIADDCVIELRASPVINGAAAAGVLPAAHTLTALPWDSSRIRLCVNGISYGTGPLVLRDGDKLTVQPIHTRGAKRSYTYAIKALPPSPSGDENGMRDRAALESSANIWEDSNRLRNIMSNAEEYAKWNNFYSDRFTNLATFRLPPSDEARPTGQIHKCGRGHYVQTRGVAPDSVESNAHAPDAAHAQTVLDASTDLGERLPSAHTRTLVTLLPSLPTLLESRSWGAQPSTSAHTRLPAMCCCCPFMSPSSDSSLRPHRNRPSCSAAAEPSASIGRKSESLQGGEVAPSWRRGAEQSSWVTYVQACRGECAAAPGASPDKEAFDTPGSGTFVSFASLDRKAAGLLNRIGVVESALIGLRYE
ncbi:hypothetical protein JKF63_01817 [Porcisia hertigi]|uniref:Uncharacterized protein n=1 Tax=Porcisia hertigi TaxID=2761500 RepID=A0A836L0R0_9TRYP|nr:hypothetical protein JKF63_01817 [Porcisia hertigi]